MGKVFPGQPWRPETAAQRNGWDDAADFYAMKARRRDNPTKRRPIPTDLIKLRNDSGAGVGAGRVLEIGTKLITTVPRDALWFAGEEPVAAGKGIAIALRPIPEDAIDWCQVSGVCLAKVIINDADHRWADVTNGSSVLSSNATTGRVEIIQKLASGTGEKDCLVRIGTGPTGGGGVPKWQTFNWDMFGVIAGINYVANASVTNPPSPGTWTHPDWQIVSNKITCQNSGWYRFDFDAWGWWQYTSGGPATQHVQGHWINTTSATPAAPTGNDNWYWFKGLAASWEGSFKVSWCELRECTAGEWLAVVLILTGSAPQTMDCNITIGERITF